MFNEDFPQAALDNLGAYGPGIATAVIALVAGWFLSGWLSRLVVSALPSRRAFNATIRPLTAQIVRYGIMIVAIVIALGELGVQTTSILAVLGAAGLAVALALQDTLRNLAAGIMLIWLRPLRSEEYIDADGIAGTVQGIGLFATELRSADGIYVFAPNQKIWDATIVNYSRDKSRRFDLIVGIAYDADIAKARKVMLDLARKDSRVLDDPEAVVYVNSLGDSSVDMMLRVWTKTDDYWDVRFELSEKVKLGFDAAGVEIPFPQLTLHTLGDGPTPLDAGQSPGEAPKGPPRQRRARPVSDTDGGD